MDIEGLIQKITVFTQDNLTVTVVLGIFVVFLLLRHPKKLFSIVLFLIVAYGLAWLFEMLSTKGLG